MPAVPSAWSNPWSDRADRVNPVANRDIKLYASLACADFLHLEEDLGRLAAAGVDGFHVDIMDGRFVPNFALNLDIVRMVRQVSALPMDVHLMVEQPERYIEEVAQSGAEFITIHQEATVHLQRTLTAIHGLGARAGVALNPATALDTLEYVMDDLDLILIMTVNPGFAGQKLVRQTIQKIDATRRMIDVCGRPIDLQVDGNVSFEHAPTMVQAGANWLVGGTSSLFASNVSYGEAVTRLKRT